MYQVTDNSTVHSRNTPHGKNTPHRWPVSSKLSLVGILSDLAIQLYPTGRAFYTLKNGIKDLIHIAINRSFIRIINDAKSTIDSTFPDNDNFNVDDCSLWEYRLGIVTNTSLSVVDRRAAILRKTSRGRNVPARQSPSYIQYQLQVAGFNVYVHENIFLEGGIWIYKTPQEITAGGTNIVQHGNGFQHGIGAEHGASGAQVIANSFQQNESFSVGTESLWATFFIGGETLGSFAVIPVNRMEEFRELVLTLKPAHTVAFTFITNDEQIKVFNDNFNDTFL